MVRVGLLAASRIAEAAVVQPSRDLDGVEVTAVAARDRSRAEEAAARWGIPHAFASYEELLGSGVVDAVYVATPASHHRELVEAAVSHDLAVLCEKPFAANAADARRASAAVQSTDLVVMEAFHWRYHPLVAQMRAAIDRIGPLRRVEGWFDVLDGHIPRSDIRWQFELGGGATMDLGCYPISWARWVVGAEPEVTDARAESTAEGVDLWLEADLEWPGGVTGRIRSSMVAGERGIGLQVMGENGTVRVDNPLAPQHGTTISVRTADAEEVFEAERSSTYLHQLRAFRDAVAVGAPYPTTVDEAVRNMEVVDACYRAAGLPVRPGRP